MKENQGSIMGGKKTQPWRTEKAKEKRLIMSALSTHSFRDQRTLLYGSILPIDTQRGTLAIMVTQEEADV